ncbi:MAG: DUF72 domain-containing protein [Desulfurococcaceae archaeon]|nr:DUF72 domain-containing protein [Desulfurococcaceae archaeon]
MCGPPTPRCEVYVGTSGWLYDWNEGSSLDWYVSHSGLNAVELNASFYRFPFRNQVLGWARRGRALRWSVKVHRSITHLRKLGEASLATWGRFRELFSPMDDLVDFYLFQMPPNFSCSPGNLARVETFHSETGLGLRMAVEFRHGSCFTESTARWAEGVGLTLVSVDSPVATWIASSGGVVYLRMHGRSSWYAHDYSYEELAEIAGRVRELSPGRVYVFFNNDHWMLDNARAMLRLLRELLS